MNGFSGPYNRWTFAIPLFISAGSAILFNERFNLTRSELRAMGLSAVAFSSVPLMIADAGDVTPFRLAYPIPVAFAWLGVGLAGLGILAKPIRPLKQQC